MSAQNDAVAYEKALAEYEKRVKALALEKAKPPRVIVTFDSEGQSVYQFEGYIDPRMAESLRLNWPAALNFHWNSLRNPTKPMPPSKPTAIEEPKKTAVGGN